MELNEIKDGLTQNGYIPNKKILYALSAAINDSAPILIEGAPGVGKTSVAQAVAKFMDCEFIRVQFYEGITADKILYDYNYQKQLLTIESIKSALEQNLEGKTIEEAISITKDIDFYGRDFLIERPILKAITRPKRCVLLLDEIDKCSEEIEYALLEVLENYNITIPQFGTVSAITKPIVFITSNGYRALSDAFKRRCGYLYIEQKTTDEIFEILKLKAKADEKICSGVSKCMSEIFNLTLKQVPSVSEAIDWANFIQKNFSDDMDSIDYSICMLAKNNDDRKMIEKSGIIKKNLFN